MQRARGLIPGQGSRFRMVKLKILSAATKTWSTHTHTHVKKGWKRYSEGQGKNEENKALVCKMLCVCMLSRSVVSDYFDLMDCSPPGSSVHGIFQARILEWGAISFLGDPPHLGIKPFFLHLPYWQVDSLPLQHLGSPTC